MTEDDVIQLLRQQCYGLGRRTKRNGVGEWCRRAGMGNSSMNMALIDDLLAGRRLLDADWCSPHRQIVDALGLRRTITYEPADPVVIGSSEL